MRTTLIAVALAVTTLTAQSSDEVRRLTDAAVVLDEIMAAGDKAVPRAIIEKAAGIAVFPSLIKGGFVVGGQRGHGVLSVRDKKTGGWSAPAFLTITGGSIGAQFGAQAIALGNWPASDSVRRTGQRRKSLCSPPQSEGN